MWNGADVSIYVVIKFLLEAVVIKLRKEFLHCAIKRWKWTLRRVKRRQSEKKEINNT